MTGPPAYFERIRLKAARRWDQLEQDPELAGPWHQLFRQVQSPRHVLSELLQNADDAGATEASARIENNVFIFEHNGEDFTEEHFASLCGFGYSNKRTLHTIGFRGIGFKSTFSLGDCVELFTPTLAIRFDRKRFTEPRWVSGGSNTDGKTRIRVEIGDERRRGEVEKNLEEWFKSPVSLLFFKHIRKMQVGEHAVHWGSVGPGPIPDSEWMALDEQKDGACLLLRSEAETFPDEALTEIRQERMLGVEEEADFPPCRIEIVVGAKGRLFVVLPTRVETELPFACNAPFIQDPARLKIKDPETSATNRWLLERAGRLAAAAMLNWLGQSQLSITERAAAYGLFPDVNRDDNSLEGVCGTIVEEAFAEAIEGRPLLLTEGGELTLENQSVIIPRTVVDTWPAEEAAKLLDESGRPPLCQQVETADCKKLLRWGVVEEIDKQKFLASLQSKPWPKPRTWRHLLNLWAYIAPEVTGYRHDVRGEDLRIVPVQGKDVLYAATAVVRLGERRLLQSEDDWEFLATHLIVLNQGWPRFLSEERRTTEDQRDGTARERAEAAHAVLKQLGLDDTSDVNRVIDRVAAEFFSQKRISVQECVRLAQIAAKLGATAGDSFHYVTRDRRFKSAKGTILFDGDGTLEELVPAQQREAQLLHDDYIARFSSCSREDWSRWVSSGRAGLLTFIPFSPKRFNMYRRRDVEQEARRRGLGEKLHYPYVTDGFVVEDWDFDEIYWSHWQALARNDGRLWTKVAERLLSQRDVYWNRARSARLLQVATTGNERSMTYDPLLPGWALRLRDVPCLPDTRGFHRKPGDLLRRTPETEPLMDVEPFIYGRLDTEATRPLLDLLGVRRTPAGPDRLLECLRALATAEAPPVHEVDKWYRRLDQMVDTCATAEFQKIRQAFRIEKLILTQDGGWATAAAVFLSSGEEDVPGVAVVRSSVGDLTLWRKIGLAERPTADLAIQWLKELPSGQVLSQDEARRVRALLVRYPVRVWEECAHWINLAGEWARTGGLSYALTMQSLIPWAHLHPWVKQKTGDFQRLPGEVTSAPPFSSLPPLALRVEERLAGHPTLPGRAEMKEWLTTVGTELRRVELDSDRETERVRALAHMLARTTWYTTPGIEIIPYIDRTPAGTPRWADVLWLGQALYVDQLPRAKLARRVPEEIGKAFGRADIKAALDYSFERAREDVREYLWENFTLSKDAGAPETESDGSGAEQADKTGARSTEPGAGTDETVGLHDSSRGGTQGASGADAEGGYTETEQSDGDQHETMDGTGHVVGPRRKTPDRAKASIIEGFARAQGFRKDSDGRFCHPDGSWIGRAEGARFPWERRTATGDLVRYYWAKDHCLEREPLELEADVWGLIEQHPGTYALILSNAAGSAVEVTGDRLRAMRDGGEVTLYPAAYRLVYKHDRQA
ncbi:MAG: ATPase [Candidatus Rokubacteria bacterium]|nr:ATPase [Candidatus Rokubacteria bacterium]